MKIGDKIIISIPEVSEQKGETKLILSLGNDGLTIQPEGTGIYEGDFAPILIERWEGKVRLICWPDIDEQEPVIQDMSGALVANSVFAWQHYDNAACPDCGTDIPDTARQGESCANCGHVWAWGPCDDGWKHGCGGTFEVISEYPDTGTSVDLYEVVCHQCGAKGTLSVENQDNSYSFSEDET